MMPTVEEVRHSGPETAVEASSVIAGSPSESSVRHTDQGALLFE